MTTIEERAREYAEKSFAQRIKIPEEEITERQKSRIMNGYVATYEKIAREQMAIDDKAMDMLNEACDNTIKIVKDETIRKVRRCIKQAWAMRDSFAGNDEDFVEYTMKLIEEE